MKALVYLPLLAAALLLGWQLTRPDAPDIPTVASTAPSNEQAAPASLLRSPQPTSSTVPQAASLRGTEVDGRLQTDADGNLLISDQLRHLFDYYLSTAGEQQHEQIVAQVFEKLADGGRVRWDMRRRQLLIEWIHNWWRW